MAAAVEAAHAGAFVGLIDQGPCLGGKVLQPEASAQRRGAGNPFTGQIRRRLHGRLHTLRSRIRVFTDSEVWHISGDRCIEFSSGGELHRAAHTLHCRRLIVSPGALERVIPCPGWTLPGVFTVGGLNTLVKRGIAPGRRCLVVGSGILLPLLVHHLVRTGIRVTGVATPMTAAQKWPHLPALGSGLDASRWIDGLQFVWAFIKRRIPVYTSCCVARITGDESIRSVVLTDVDPQWRPVKGTEKTIATDTVALGHGLIPALELTRQLGCEHRFDPVRGYWRTVSDARSRTTRPWVLVAGDGVEIKGYAAAADQGRIAGLEAASQLGFNLSSEQKSERNTILRKLNRQRRFSRALDRLTRPQPGVFDLLTDDTVICRCEEISLKSIKTAVAHGARDINDIKRRTRLGMGPCQGRFCGQVINELLWKLTGSQTEREIFTPRIPVRVVSFGELADVK